jgi:hypothetical protein
MDDILESAGEFCVLVGDLEEEKDNISPSELLFLERCVTFKEKLLKDAPFIFSVECADLQSHRVTAAMNDETWYTKEAMRMYEATLSASFDEEEKIKTMEHRLEVEAAKLKERKKLLRKDIQEDITKLLKKRKSLLELQIQQRRMGRTLSQIGEDLEVAQASKEALTTQWTAAMEAGDNVGV